MSSSASQPRTTASPEGQAHRSPITWNEAPLRSKTTLLVFLAVFGGCLLGLVLSEWNYPWQLVGGLFALATGLVLFAQHWICQPVELLAEQVDRTCRPDRPVPTRDLPIARQDEVGRIARAIHKLSRTSLRDHSEAKNLRRTLDHQVERATNRATAQLQKLAMRDAMTNLGNRRFLDENLHRLVQSCLTSHTDLLCLLVDIDEFKSINDTHGHAKGDEVIQLLGRVIQGSIRNTDYAVRLGGDEFAVLLPACRLSQAETILERMYGLFRREVRTVIPTDPRPDLSIGVASLRRDGVTTAEELLAKADLQLYAAKNAGRAQAAGL